MYSKRLNLIKADCYSKAKNKLSTMYPSGIRYAILLLIFFMNCSEKMVNKSTTNIENEKTLEYPIWLTSLYPDSLPTDYSYYFISQNLIKFTKVNDSLSVCLYETNDGTCGKTILATQLNKKGVNNIEIEINCDHDQSIPEYTWSELLKVNNLLVRTIEFHLYVPDTLLNKDRMFKKDKSFADYEHLTITDSVFYDYKILETGEIEKNFHKINYY